MIAAICKGSRLLWGAARKPAVLARWLIEAHCAQTALATFLAFALFALPGLLDRILPPLYPPIEVEKKILGIFSRSTSRPDPRLEARAGQITTAVWALGIAGVALLLFAALPRTAAAARKRARRLCDRADSMLASDPGESLELYRSALALTVDAQEQTLIASRLSETETRIDLPASQRVTVLPDVDLRALHAAETLVVAPLDPRVVAGRYRIDKELGRGGMGVVYRALDLVLEREVALKQLPHRLGSSPELVRRFRQEARLLAQLMHPSIVQVHDLIEERGQIWIALELVGGGTLADAMRRRGGALEWREAVRLAAQISDGLAFAHTRGVIHRDVKPINVLLSDSDPPAAKLADFGLARWIESSEHTQHGALLGSARYMSPEQAAGRAADERSDLYSLGVTLFEMLCGRAPYEGEVAAILAQHLSGTPPRVSELRPELPPELDALVMSMISRAPEERPVSAEIVRRALAGLT
jgi:hypothetical protein